MANFKELLPSINTFVLDIDGVLSDGSIIVTGEGEQLRTMSTRDGLAITMALKKGYKIVIISGGNDQSVVHRFNYLGIKDKPLFKFNDGYLCLNVNFLYHKFYRGLLFDFHKLSGIDKVDKFKSFI